MGDGQEVILNLLVSAIFGAISAAVAHSKGRNVVGWFLLGFLFSCISLIIILCLSNLKEEQAKWAANEIEQRRLREQLRQEQLKNEALRQHTIARLDVHDKKLGIDTRDVPTALPLPGSARTLITGNIPAARAIPPPGYPAQNWYFEDITGQQGPYSYSILQQHARQGTLTPDTLIWAEGMQDWQPAHTIPTLFST